MTTKREYAIHFAFEGSGWEDGYELDTLEEAEAAFEAECRDTDPHRFKNVRLVLQESDYDGDECVEVREVDTIKAERV